MIGKFHPGLDTLARGTVYAVLLASPLAGGGRPSWATAGVIVLTFLATLFWLLHMLKAGRLEWRRTALDGPLAALVVFVVVQIAIGNGSFAAWALGPPATAGDPLPAPFLTIGTIAPQVTMQSLLVLLAYAAVYVVVVNTFRRRRHLEALVITLVVTGTAIAAFALADYFARDLLRWRDGPHRAIATFVNADHFGAWLNLVIFVAVGYVLARSARKSSAAGATLSERLEALGRRYAIVGAIVVMVLALVFTLSRGAILSFLVTVAIVLVIGSAIGWARRTFVGVGLLLAVALSYAAWLGLAPLLARLYEDHTVLQRLAIYRSAARLVKDFPVLGTGLGTYPEISARYQTTSLAVGEMFLNAAHSDWLQILVETGVIGLALALWAVVRVARDLIGVHLVGRGTCPVHGGEGEWARRHDPFSVGVSFGALGAVISLLVHSLVDFSARMPANGALAAACLGIATVAVHTRFGTEEGFVAARWSWDVPGKLAAVGSAVACVVVVVVALVAVRPAVVEALLGSPNAVPRSIESLVDVAGSDPHVLLARGNRSLDTAYRVWAIGVVGPGQPVGALPERRIEAMRQLDAAARDLRQALAAVPSWTVAHDRLAWTYELMAHVDSGQAPKHAAAAVAHLHRAIALAPEHPFLHRALATLVVKVQPHAPIELGLTAARNAVQRRPDFLSDLQYDFMVLPLTDDQWTRFVPATFEDRLVLADVLESRRLQREAAEMYLRAIELAEPADVPLARWMRASLLARQGDHAGALRELGSAMQKYPDNPDLHLAAADALAAMREPAALDIYRVALAKAEDRLRSVKSASAFVGTYRGRLADLVSRRLVAAGPAPLAPYRRPLARYLAHRELWRQALQESDALIAEAPKDATGHFVRALALEGLGQPEDALQAYDAAVSADGRNVEVRLRLARLLVQTKQPFQAIKQWGEVLTTDPGNLEAALSMARTYAQQGSKGAAFGAYQQVLVIAPDNAEARQALTRFGWIPR